MKTTGDAAFETVIESHILQNGYVPVAREGFDRERAIFPEVVLAFIRETQPPPPAMTGQINIGAAA